MNEYLKLFRSLGLVDAYLENSSEHWDKRRVWTREFSWAIPTDSALQIIADLGPIVEIGAGTGYWAHLLRAMGVDVKAYDLYPPSENGWHPGAAQWTKVVEGGPERAGFHEDRTLVLCWPPYSSEMAANALKVYQGTTVVYIGEGNGGCTGDDEFHELLESHWDIELHQIPQWYGIHDILHVCKRKVRSL